MKIAVLGTGMVGRTIATKLVALGHEVILGSRSAGNEKAVKWVAETGPRAREGSFNDAAGEGEIIFNCTNGMASLEALRMAGKENLSGKILVDIANPLDFSQGMPPTLSVCNNDSLAEQIQREFPDAKVVKTLNTTNCQIMVSPSMLEGSHDVFVSGNDPDAKKKVVELLTHGFGWKRVIDLGDITTARGTEQLLPIWIRLYGMLGHAHFNFSLTGVHQ